MLYLLFFLSGLSGLIYQVVWVRVFGNVFGNTIYSASLVVAVFMLGLGVGSYLVGAWSDRRYAERPESLLRAYGYFEIAIAAMGLGISVLLPHLDRVAALVSSYSLGAAGWHVLSPASYLARVAISIVLLAPITLLMGGTLTLLIRHLVRNDLEIGGWRIALLYAVNTAGAALGCFLTDFALVPAAGLWATQMAAVFFNLVAGLGALWLSVRLKPDTTEDKQVRLKPDTTKRRGKVRPKLKTIGSVRLQPDDVAGAQRSALTPFTVPLTALALGLSGFAAMGMEILWFRHFSILLGGFRAVFSLLLTIILAGIGVGSLGAGFLQRRTARPAQWLIGVQALFVAATLLGLIAADAGSIEEAVRADPAYQAAAGRGAVETLMQSGLARALTEFWFNARPILLEVGLPALLMGFSFPLANAVIQRAERPVGRRAGALYFANTTGAVCGSLAAGFLLLPLLGIQASATVLMICAALAMVPLYLTSAPSHSAGSKRTRRTFVSASAVAFIVSTLVAGAALGLWLRLPSDAINIRALGPAPENERLLTVSEGLTEVIAVTEVPGKGRTLVTNGHPMSSTRPLSQRYMRALAHIPLLFMEKPEAVLVIGFGVGNTTHAATLHPTIGRVEVADLSTDILAHASYFKDANGDVLGDPRVVVYINDGRQHLQMQPAASYDLITLEPPPIGYAGVASLYSKEFYELARTRLKPRGYISQWLPAYQVPGATTLAMIRAFIDVFPQSVLISGAEADLLLVGTTDSRVELDPERLAGVLATAPAVQRDLQRLDLGSVREIAGTFVGSAQTLAGATRDIPPVTDDRPMQEYGVRSLLNFGEAVPTSVVDLSRLGAWCPKCFVDGKPVPLVEGLDTYLALLNRAYTASPAEVLHARRLADLEPRAIAGSVYLGAFVPESADLHNVLGIALAGKGQFDKATEEFREALRLEPESAETHWHLGAALAASGQRDGAIEHLRRSVQLDPRNGQAHYDLGSLLLESRWLDDAGDEFRAAVLLMPDSAAAYNGRGMAFALQGKLDEAIDQFKRALAIDPESPDARRNLAIALGQRRR